MKIDETVKYFGTQLKIAKILNCVPNIVSMWRRRGGIPLDKQKLLEKASNGVLKASAADIQRNISIKELEIVVNKLAKDIEELAKKVRSIEKKK